MTIHSCQAVRHTACILISVLAVCLKALALGPTALASKVQALALRPWT